MHIVELWTFYFLVVVRSGVSIVPFVMDLV